MCCASGRFCFCALPVFGQYCCIWNADLARLPHLHHHVCDTLLDCRVGVDDAFIMLQSWDQHKHIRDLKQRLCVVMVHVGPSITITSLTNTVAFGIGYATPTPQMSLFCLCTSIAVLFDYFLTFTLLAPIVLLVSPKHKLPALPPTEEPSVAEHKLVLKNISPSIHKYSAFLHSKKGRVAAFVLSVTLYIIATIGVANMKSTFEPSKAFPSDSPLASSMDGIREVFNEFFPINVFVNRPPNISDVSDYANFNRMVGTLEQIPESYGQNRTILWLRAFEAFDQKTSQLWEFIGMQAPKNYTPSYENLDFFLQQLNYPPTIKMEADENGVKRLKAFQFTIIAKDMSEWSNRAIVEQKCREILERFPEFNASIYDGDSAVLNLLLTVKIDLIGSITVTVICMTIICSFFIPNQIGVAIIAFTISSICYTLVGIMSWWGADLDPVTIVDVLLATGFSVDYTAHFARDVCPMLQAGTSTVLCMLPLIFVPTYAIVAFAKTVFVVVAVGLLHGLFFMPVLLCLTPQKDNQLFKYCENGIGRRKKAPPANTQASIEPLITMPSVVTSE
uniref:SSD domain-containing protein n=1 Tax=Ditylenchus dipsaci TaxID=166011 RepID=A0A915D3S9_9BILA